MAIAEERLRLLVVGSGSKGILILNEMARELEEEIEVHVVQDEEEALEFLHRSTVGSDGSRGVKPHLLLLDDDSVGVDVKAFLREAKAHENLRRIPTVALLGAGSADSLQSYYELNCNCVVSKPPDLGAFVNLVGALKSFWLGVVTLAKD